MDNPKGFIKIKRGKTAYRPVCERVKDYAPVSKPRGEGESREQASRCMDCGTPFCHAACPVGNYIPEWNDLVFNLHWERAFELLDATNPLPEITGRVCPALCEFACVLGINAEPVTVRENELALVEYAFNHDLIKPRPPKARSGKKVAVIGSGPAGLSCAASLNRAGHKVFVFEKEDKIGGIMRYGIPDFKLEKKIIDRRADIWEKEGIEFSTGIELGKNLLLEKLLKDYDGVVLACGAGVPRDLKAPGRELAGIHFAMDYLTQSNRRVAGEKFSKEKLIDAKDKKVVVIGGGDTGADCVGTAQRQGAACVVQIELLPQPPENRPADQPWPKYPMILKTSTSHEEGCERRWSVSAQNFIGENGEVRKIYCESSGKYFEIEADMVILALGFMRPDPVELAEGLFVTGDMRRGPSLIVWAIYEGGQTAQAVDEYLRKKK